VLQNVTLSEKLVSDWRKSKDGLKMMPPKKCVNRTKTAKWPELVHELTAWVQI
jgi:hypothetical protein